MRNHWGRVKCEARTPILKIGNRTLVISCKYKPLRISIKCPRYFHKIYVIWDHWIELEMNVPTFSRYKYVYIYIFLLFPVDSKLDAPGMFISWLITEYLKKWWISKSHDLPVSVGLLHSYLWTPKNLLPRMVDDDTRH